MITRSREIRARRAQEEDHARQTLWEHRVDQTLQRIKDHKALTEIHKTIPPVCSHRITTLAQAEQLALLLAMTIAREQVELADHSRLVMAQETQAELLEQGQLGPAQAGTQELYPQQT